MPMAEHDDQLQCLELCPICRGAEVLRASASPELRSQWHSVQRETLLTMRTLIDHYLERLADAEAASHPPVEDIPIE